MSQPQSLDKLTCEPFRSGAIACKFRGTGQTCVCANRIYVQSSVYAEFASRLAEKVAAFKVGNGLDKDTYVPPPARPPSMLTLTPSRTALTDP